VSRRALRFRSRPHQPGHVKTFPTSAAFTSALAFNSSVADANTPVAVHGKLVVRGTKLCDSKGEPIQLRGVSTHGLQWHRQCLNDGSLDALARDWRADVLRIALYIQEGGYETDPRHFTDLVNRYVDAATRRGLYAIVDWHLLNPGDPVLNLRHARTFFTEVAAEHRDKPNVVYEIANEPHGVSWRGIRHYAEEIIARIRREDPDSVILVGTRGWSSLGVSEGSDEREVIRDPVNARNVLYTFHFFAGSHGTGYLAALSRAAERLPLFVTEFGTQNASGDGANDFAMSRKYLDIMAREKIGWTYWNYSDDRRSGAVFREGTCPDGPWTGTAPLKTAGL
jgi:endoglucanase